MPCNSEYLAPTYREQELRRAARLLVFVAKQLGNVPAPYAIAAAEHVYGAGGERAVVDLCAALNGMGDEERERVVYDAHDKDSRDLADWWEEHQCADAERIKERWSKP